MRKFLTPPNVPAVQFDTASTEASASGKLVWNEEDGTLDLGMNGSGGVVQQIGLEQYYRVKNQTGSTLTNGKVARAVGSLGSSGLILAGYAIADGTHNTEYVLGVFTESIVNGGDGYVTSFGKVRNIDTTGTSVGETWADGDVLYLSATTAGELTKVQPASPNRRVIVALVIHAAANGTLFVRPTHGLLTLTTTGTSGAATLVGDVLNIPQYSGGGGGVASAVDDLNSTNSVYTWVGTQAQYDALGTWDSYTEYWITDATGASGAVTSVGLSLPSIFSVTNSPVTTTGTLTATLASQMENRVWASPDTTNGPPTFRALVSNDIPTLAQSKITNLTTDLAVKAPLASPTFTGTPAAPTATVGTSTTQLATTAFVNAEIANDAVTLSGNQTVAGNKTFSGTTALAEASTIDSIKIGFRNVPVNLSNGALTLSSAYDGECVYKNNTTAYTYSIPDGLADGTIFTFANCGSAGNLTIAMSGTEVLRLAGTTTTGSRTVAPYGEATVHRVGGMWLCGGPGVT